MWTQIHANKSQQTKKKQLIIEAKDAARLTSAGQKKNCTQGNLTEFFSSLKLFKVKS